jgi:hypothetical protein
VRLDGRAVLGDGREIDVRVTDLSRNGCRVESGETLRIGERIRLRAAPLDNVAAVIRWELGGTAGVRFVEGDWT